MRQDNRKVNSIRKNGCLLILAGLFILQAGFARCYVHFSRWFDQHPIYTDDYSLHYADALYKGAYLKASGMPFGYNPGVRAGTACNAVFTVDNYGWALFVNLLSFIPPGLAFKLYFLLTLLGIPLILYRSALNFGLERRQAVLCSVLGTLFLHVSVCVDFLYWGTVSYILSCYLCLLTVSFFFRFMRSGGVSNIIWTTVLFAVGLWCHVFSMLHVAVPLAVCYLGGLRSSSPRQHGLTFLCLALVFLLNSIWLVPCLIFLPDVVNNSSHLFFPYTTTSLFEPLNTYLFFDIKFNQYMNIPFPKSGFVDLLLMATGALGMLGWVGQKESLKALLFAVTVVCFFMLAYYGSFWDFTATLTPLRFVIYMNICLCVPAAAGLTRMYDALLRDRSRTIRTGALAAAGYLVVTLLATPYYHLFVKEDFQLLTRLPQPVGELTEWICANTNPGGRILIENSDFESCHQYYGTHVPYLLPLMTNREYIGNYAYYATSPDAFTSFNCGYLFRRRIGDYAPDDLRPYMDVYNIKWIIAWSDEARRFFEAAPQHYRFRVRVDKFFVYEVDRDGTFFLRGRGRVEAGPDRIVLSDLQPDDGVVVLSYHWMRYLRADPAAELEQTFFLNDPVGFILLRNPPERLVISTSHRAVFGDWTRMFDLFKK